MGWAERANPNSLRNLSPEQRAEAIAKREAAWAKKQSRKRYRAKIDAHGFARAVLAAARRREIEPTKERGDDGKGNPVRNTRRDSP